LAAYWTQDSGLARSPDTKLVIMEGYRSYTVMIKFDIKVLITADKQTRIENLLDKENRSPRILSDMRRSRFYYDLILDNSRQYRLPPGVKVELLSPQPGHYDGGMEHNTLRTPDIHAIPLKFANDPRGRTICVDGACCFARTRQGFVELAGLLNNTLGTDGAAIRNEAALVFYPSAGNMLKEIPFEHFLVRMAMQGAYRYFLTIPQIWLYREHPMPHICQLH